MTATGPPRAVRQSRARASLFDGALNSTLELRIDAASECEDVLAPQRLLILVVEDEALTRDLILLAFFDAGFDASGVASAAEAIDLMGRADLALHGVVTDINLSGGPTGWDVARFARSRSCDIPIVYVTGDSAARRDSRGVRGSALVEKPFSPEEVVGSMRRLLEGH